MLQIGICDDETVIAARMEELIFETCRAEGIQAGVEVFYSGNTLLEEVRRGTRYDLLYLDIHMQKGNGIICHIWFHSLITSSCNTCKAFSRLL